jgi:hypothetical protein
VALELLLASGKDYKERFPNPLSGVLPKKNSYSVPNLIQDNPAREKKFLL